MVFTPEYVPDLVIVLGTLMAHNVSLDWGELVETVLGTCSAKNWGDVEAPGIVAALKATADEANLWFHMVMVEVAVVVAIPVEPHAWSQ